MVLANRTLCNHLLGFINRRVLIRTYSLHSCSMKHAEPESNDFKTTKKPRLDMQQAKLSLTSSERRLINFLLDVAQSFNASNYSQDKLILRFAGGWVRDKLLGIPSNDIDVAINSMTGSSFTQQVQNYIMKEENMEKHSLSKIDVGRCYKTAANPEKSKHLETSTMNVMGYDVDFVNLRKETYSTESRNPIMEFGSPEEDALRRDCTINSLFYNIHTDEVEDYTGGLKDLAEKTIRTPVDPKTTFLDDPLRILRLIRFANRLDFVIDLSSEVYINNPEVLDAFHRKIARERVQVEIFKMLKGNNPRGALQHIDRLGLYNTIFSDVELKDVAIPDVSNWRHAYNRLQELICTSSLNKSLISSESEVAWLLAAYTPWSTVEEQLDTGGRAKLAWGAQAARLALKAENKKINLISCCLKNYKGIIELKEMVLQKDPLIYQRDTVGKLIRKWDLQGNWRLQIIFALMVEAMICQKYSDTGNKNDQFKESLQSWKTFVNHLENMKLLDVSSTKNIIDGKTLVKALGVKPGVWVGPVLEYCMDWTLRNPDVDDSSIVIEEVKSRREELGIPPPKIK